ncbi:MAG TPA: hypothetical protein VGM91_23415 [Conexibacter sp.]
MIQTTGNQAPVEGTVEFVQHILPGLDPGEYMLTASQTVSTQTQTLGNRYFFAVQGPRFALDPGELFATYPPDQATGEFDATLPHAVLTNRTLPWQRFPTLEEPERRFAGTPHDRDIPSWLVVLLFDADDEAAFPGFRAQAAAGTVRNLFIPRTGAVQPQGYSYFWAQKDLGETSDGLAQHLDYGQSPDDPCQLLDVPLALFWAVAPSCQDLMLTAHARNVNVVRKATENGVPAGRIDLSRVPGTSDFSLVLGNRSPQAGVRAFAHLVSLEGLAPFLPADPATSDDPGEVAPPTTLADGTAISPGGFLRLVSLASWSFTSVGDSSQFEQLLLGLSPKTTGATPDFSIGLPGAGDAQTTAAKALGMGYTALEHHTRDGGQTVSWYRGPLLPGRVAGARLPASLSSSDAATSYDPATGMFDLSYAGAWQLGRLLAIQDKRFSTVLCDWRRENLRGVVGQMEALVVQQTLDRIQLQLRDDSVLYPLLQAFAPSAPAPAAATTDLVAGGLTGSRAIRATAHRAALASPDALASLLVDELQIPAEIYTWLARLKLLDGVPFRYLVPDERMLPSETIRFFQLDMNWVNALIDGALSIGRHGAEDSPEAAHDAAVNDSVHGQVSGQSRAIRPAALGLDAPDAEPLEAVTGFLLRSDVVKGWPGLEANGYTADGTLLDIVRFERLAPTVLLCLFESGGKTLHQLDLHEPAEGLHFGLSGGTSINVRTNHTIGAQGPGSQIAGQFQPVPFRAQRVVRLFRLARALNDPKWAIYIQGVYQGFDHLPSSQFALQMLRGVGLVSFIGEAGDP